jgi:nitrate/TMAO reductase-like tetraheme cytochrome c subunit
MASRWRRMIGWLRRPHAAMAAGTLLLIGLVFGVAGLAGSAAFVGYTNTEEFCISCHEMRAFPYAEFQQSAHWRSASGVKPGCPDCHVPRALGPKMWRKFQATYNELPGHFLGRIDTDSRECRECHDTTAMALDEQRPRARAQHEDAAKSGETCIDCHKGIAHTKPKLPDEPAAEEEDFSL